MSARANGLPVPMAWRAGGVVIKEDVAGEDLPQRFELRQTLSVHAGAEGRRHVERQMVAELALGCHDAGRKFVGWPASATRYLRYDEKAGLFTDVEPDAAEFVELATRVLTVLR